MTKKKKWQTRANRFSNPPSKADRKDYFGRQVFRINRKVFEGYMWETPILDRMAYYVIQGQLPNIDASRPYISNNRTGSIHVTCSS